jgi:benzoyl-CoA reductase/2-hydroxyglutaryl-CoA dehydratase subunit BcrC/BadD/HgdB
MELRNDVIDTFNDYLKSPVNSLVHDAADAGRIPIGYTCSFVPEALLMADRLFPVRLTAPGVTGTETADNYLSNFICSYTRSILEFAVEGRYDRIKGWVFVASCAHMQRLFDNLEYLKKPAFSHVIDVPSKVTDASVKWLVEELGMLSDKLSAYFSVDMSDQSIAKAVSDWNRFVQTIQSIGELRKKPDPPITGAEFHALLMAFLASPKDLIMPTILDYKNEIEGRQSAGNHRARLMLAGGHLHDPEFINIIESEGGLVVADRFCTGSIPGLMPIEMKGDPLEALAEHTFKKTMCPRMMEDFERRLSTIITTVREYNIDGVIIEVIKFCDLWGIEAMPLINALRKEGIPVLRLEREYRLGSEGQLRTRVQAFLEAMGK